MLTAQIDRFQWAALHIDDLLKLERSSDILKYLDSLPEGLREAYDRIYTHLKAKKGSAGIIADRAFLAIMSSWRPLTPDELLVVVTHDANSEFGLPVDITIKSVLDACQNLVVVTKPIENDSNTREKQPPRICRFSHLSVQEYIEENRWTRAQAHEFLTQICIQALLNPAKVPNDIGLKAARSPNSLDAKIKPESPYNTWEKGRYVDGWWIHVSNWSETRANNQKAVADLVLRFMGSPFNSSPQYRRWLESTKNVTSVTVRYFTPAKIYAKCSPASEALGGALLFDIKDALLRWIESGEVGPNDSYKKIPFLTFCAQHGNFQLCRELVLRGATINISGGPPIVAASRSLEIVRLLVENGAEVNIKTREGSSALGSAINYQATGVVKYLLDHGADINSRRDDGLSIVTATVVASNNEIAQLLLERVSQFESQNGNDGAMLELAIRHGNLDTLRLLLAKDADPNSQCVHYPSPLHTALKFRREDIANLLLDHGADAGIVNKRHGTPLHVAAERSSARMLASLLAAGASPHMVAGKYGTPLNAAYCTRRRDRNGHMEKMKLLIDAGAKVKASDYLTLTSPFNNWVALKAFLSTHLLGNKIYAEEPPTYGTVPGAMKVACSR
jgi:ankyrin repeat protein